MLGENSMGILLMIVGLSFIYISATMLFFMYMEYERELKILDYIIGFIPIIREIYMIIEVGEW